METTGTRRTLRVVRPDETEATSAAERSTEDDCADYCADYWAKVQALRDDLVRLRPAN
jgi:hypothetical protein